MVKGTYSLTVIITETLIINKGLNKRVQFLHSQMENGS